MPRLRAKKTVKLPRFAVAESLESRTMLSAPAVTAPVAVATPAIVMNPSYSVGYTPAQIGAAYGYDQISIEGGAVNANGAGQTIAIVDAYDDPTIFGDVRTFDTQFHLRAINLSVVDQTGGSNLPVEDDLWAAEISLDVEWTHAMAPAANILLVETNSASMQDLTAGVLYAESVNNVSIISMSWGGSTSFQYLSQFGSNETAYDTDFTTPTGHQGITFIAAAGDSGATVQTQYPADSPNVLSVGGTSLTLNSDGSYDSEGSWSGTAGGYSTIEPEPGYQQVAQSSGFRSVPDVSFNANPNAGFAIYDSSPGGNGAGWENVGGTSAGAPAWAALIAIADQSRAVNGESTLTGAQTLALLYELYSAPGTSGYSNYTTYFNDVVDGSFPTPTTFAWGQGVASAQATAGYDAITGLGTPRANNLVTAFTSPTVTDPSYTVGYTPAQIRTAYDFNQLSNINTSNGPVAADGTGQTIAIVDAYNDPNLISNSSAPGGLGDLQIFDRQFNLPAANISVINQTGGSTLPAENDDWAGEISLDVEWSHAMAPGAKIVLIETNSDSLLDLIAGVQYARTIPYVSVVSMSWGGSEFFQFVSPFGGSETDYDPYFTTPANHPGGGITFVASAGDSGSNTQVQYPASSPNVLSVGGTSLTTAANGTYTTESSWSGTNGGYSTIEGEPAYQNAVQNSNFRSVPDVSYDADPKTGYALYDSTEEYSGGPTGWDDSTDVIGGTSAGSPQWAALIAIANQSRAAANEPSLTSSQTLSLLYGLYSAPGTSGYAKFTSYFNDVVDKTYPPPTQFGWGYGQAFTEATTGYDAITGLGTPHANTLVTALTTNDGASSGGGTGGGTTGLPNSTIIGSYPALPTASQLVGSSTTLEVSLFNSVVGRFSGPIDITVYASADTALSSNDVNLGTLAIRRVSLAGGAVKTVKVKLLYPSGLSGNFFLISTVTAVNTATIPTIAVSAAPISILPANVDLKTSFKNGSSVAVTPGKQQNVFITVENLGNVSADGFIALSLYSSSDPTVDSTAKLLTGGIDKGINLKSGKSVTLRVTFIGPTDVTPGDYFLVASIASTTSIPDSTKTNEVTAAGTTSA